MTRMLWTRRRCALLRLLLVLGLWSAWGAEADAAAKRKKPPQVQQDPLETESNPPPPNPPPVEPTPDPEPTAKPSEKDGSGSGHSGHSSSSGSSGSSSGQGSGNNGPPPEKAGPFMFNVKIGPAFCLYPSNCPHQGAIVLDLGAALTRNRNGYLLLPVQFQFLPGASAIIVPVGFQYDVRLPFRGGYFYPRIMAGYAALLTDGQVGTPQSVLHSGVLIPELGIKYILNGRWNFGGEFFSLPFFFNSTGVQLYYRILLSAGITF